MIIQLNRKEVYKILSDHFVDTLGADVSFTVFYTESNDSWEKRNDREISKMVEPPTKENYVLYFDKHE